MNDVFKGIKVTVRLSELRYVEHERRKKLYFVFMDGSINWAIYESEWDAARDYKGLTVALKGHSRYRGIKEMSDA